MVHFSPPDPGRAARKMLRRLQMQVNQEPGRAARYKRAVSLWTRRTGRKADRQHWEEITAALKQRHPAPGYCQICLHDRDAAVEHVFPKKHYLKRVFSWRNYLLICYRCNTAKLDQFAVFHPAGSSTVVHLASLRKQYPKPPGYDPVLLNPRQDDPSVFWETDFATGSLVCKAGLSSRDTERAMYTLKLFQLDTDAALQRRRRNGYALLCDSLAQYIAVREAAGFDDLQKPGVSAWIQAITVQSRPFGDEQARLLNLLKTRMTETCPDVWQAMKQQPGPHRAMLARAPEALNW
jgi:uncharacterized protein (TIGR02646 family)